MKEEGTPLSRYLALLPHVGGGREQVLRLEGYGCWADVLEAPQARAGLDLFAWDEMRAAAEMAQRALDAGDVAYFTGRLPTRERWRVLAQWFDRASFFDIETSGLSADSIVTLVCCFHGGQPLHFLADDNLDDFLDLLESVKLLVSFNGASFDVPRVLDRFHIPGLPCAHVDLRWLCHHAGWRGGLKAIEKTLGLRRPPDLEGLGGAEAVWLWQAWSERGDDRARRTLERYCAADTAMLNVLAGRLCLQQGADVVVPEEAALWQSIDKALPDLGRSHVDVRADAAGAAHTPERPLVQTPDLFSMCEMVSETAGLTRAEKQARLRERWRQHRGEG